MIILTIFSVHFRFFNKPNELSTLLECLRIARKKDMQIPLECVEASNSSSLWRKFIEYNIIDTMLCHQSDEVRYPKAFDLIIITNLYSIR